MLITYEHFRGDPIWNDIEGLKGDWRGGGGLPSPDLHKGPTLVAVTPNPWGSWGGWGGVGKDAGGGKEGSAGGGRSIKKKTTCAIAHYEMTT